jgi:dimethylargininase
VRPLPELDACPDGVFVEDTAIVFDELAVLTRPGAASRRAEVDSMETALAPLRRCVRLSSPATLDGGDVIVAGRSVFVGRSKRSNEAAIEALQRTLGDFGYRVQGVELRGCLHLKTAATIVDEGLLLHDPDCVDLAEFPDFSGLAIDSAEPGAANALRIGARLIYPERFVRTAEKLRARGLDVLSVPADELAKAEGGVTCCSVLVP